MYMYLQPMFAGKTNASICKFITRHDFSGINYYMVYDLVYI